MVNEERRALQCRLTRRDSVTRFFALGFFNESPSPKPLIITLGSFQFFSKIRGDIRKSRCPRCTTGVNDTGGKLPPVSMTPAANLPPVSTTPAANFATSSPCVVDTGGKLPPVSTTPVANNGNNIRLQTPESKLEGKNLYLCTGDPYYGLYTTLLIS